MHSLRTSLLAGVVLAGAVLTVGIGCYWWGRWSEGADIRETERRLAQAFRDGPDAAGAWANLISDNDLAAALATCTGTRVSVQDGRRVCAIPLWLEPVKGRGPPTVR
jgi:hypothetical protein